MPARTDFRKALARVKKPDPDDEGVISTTRGSQFPYLYQGMTLPQAEAVLKGVKIYTVLPMNTILEGDIVSLDTVHPQQPGYSLQDNDAIRVWSVDTARMRNELVWTAPACRCRAYASYTWRVLKLVFNGKKDSSVAKQRGSQGGDLFMTTDKDLAVNMLRKKVHAK